MLEHFSIGAPAHRVGFDTSPPKTSSPVPSPRKSLSDIKQRAQSTVTEVASHLDDLNPRNDFISSYYSCNSSNPLGASQNEKPLPFDPAVDPVCENELILDPHYENDTKSAANSRASLCLIRLSRQLQRQLNSQLLYTHSQVEAISELVEEMLSSESQCTVTTPLAVPQPPAGPLHTPMLDALEVDDTLPDSIDDEGFCEGGAEDEEIDADTLLINLRRASAPLGIRRRQEYARIAVFSKPRMRKKIMRRKRPQNREENGEETGM